VSEITHDHFGSLQIFEGILSIEPMPIFDLTFDGSQKKETVPIKIPEERVDYPVIGVLDSGIKGISHLKPWIHDEYFPLSE
jgi:hypothetical protein